MSAHEHPGQAVFLASQEVAQVQGGSGGSAKARSNIGNLNFAAAATSSKGGLVLRDIILANADVQTRVLRGRAGNWSMSHWWECRAKHPPFFASETAVCAQCKELRHARRQRKQETKQKPKAKPNQKTTNKKTHTKNQTPQTRQIPFAAGET